MSEPTNTGAHAPAVAHLRAFLAYAQTMPPSTTPFALIPYEDAIQGGIPFAETLVHEGRDWAVFVAGDCSPEETLALESAGVLDADPAVVELRAILRDLDALAAELKALPDDALPENYDAVCLAEWTDALAHRGSATPSVASFLASFWESHHMLAESIPYERAVKRWIDWARDLVQNKIEETE